MKTRIISGACYVAILVAFYLLKIFVSDFCFDVLIYAFSLIGTFEILRATKEKTTQSQRNLVGIFALGCIPACSVCEYFYSYGLHVACAGFFGLAILLLSLFVLDSQKTTPENTGIALFCTVYPTLLLSLFVLGNHIESVPALANVAFHSDLFVLFVFVVSPCADAVAFLFGCTMRKRFPKKMAPNISPNKTIIGGIGGVIGGMVGAIALYFVYNGLLYGSFENMGLWLPLYIFIGAFSSIATEFGDLIESSIKRKLEIKDMGKIMPGHGGVLDRIDGTMLSAVVTYLVFAVVHLIA